MRTTYAGQRRPVSAASAVVRAALVGIGLVFVAGCGQPPGQVSGAAPAPPASAVAPLTATPPAAPAPAALPAAASAVNSVPTSAPTSAEPATVDVPSIGVRSDLVRLELDARGELAAPTDYAKAGWFAGGPTPGAIGPAVLAGHVDSTTGPAIFYRLRDLRAGDPISVTRRDGSVVRFAVTEVRRVAKDAFPTAEVYGPVPDPELRLITCGGEFDRSRRSYRDNVVVFARLAG